ncbi:MAG: ABC transporter permease [Nocardioidaceae bacterium]|nr:ABC transporter permease [Nocardioidaceae bacterium]
MSIDTRRLARRATQVGKPLALFTVLVAIWQVVVDKGLVPTVALASPSEVLDYIVTQRAQLWTNSQATIKEIVLAFAIAFVVGVVLAILIKEFQILHDALLPLLVVTQLVPSVAIAPLLVLILGFGDAPKIATAAVIAFFPILINTVAGLDNVEKEAIDLTRSLRASRIQTLRYLELPSAIPYMFAGTRIGITLSVIGAVVGEFVTADKGLGYLILQGSSTLDPTLVFASLVVLAGIGLLLFGAVRVVEYFVVPWNRAPAQRGGRS